MRILFFGFICCWFILGCNTKKQEYRKIVGYWMNKEIMFPTMNAKYYGRDTLCSEIWKAKYKILHYVDTTGCTSCKLHLFDWKLYLKKLQDEQLDVSCIFVLGIPDFEEFERLQQENHFDYLVFYDPKMELDSLNHFPSSLSLQTFLLDGNNRVVGIGDPVNNKTIAFLYHDLIENEIESPLKAKITE